jgi:hypothetical protein
MTSSDPEIVGTRDELHKSGHGATTPQIRANVGLAGIEPATSALSGMISRSAWNRMTKNDQVIALGAHGDTA